MDSTALVVIGTAVGGILVTLINAWLSEGIKKANQASIERLKSDLSQAAFEYQTRFARLHDRRVEVIAELYRALVATEMAFNAAMLPVRRGSSYEELDRRQEEDNRAAVDAMNRFIECFRANEVWLDAALASHVETLELGLRQAWWQFMDPDPEKGWASQKTDAWERVSSTEVPRRKAEIRAAMREMLGATPALPTSAEGTQ